MWNKNISDLLDAVRDDTISLRETEEVSASRVKELALQKLRREQRGTGRRRRWPRKALAIAAVAAVLSGTALAAGVSQGSGGLEILGGRRRRIRQLRRSRL